MLRRVQRLQEAKAEADAKARDLYESNARLEAHVQARNFLNGTRR